MLWSIFLEALNQDRDWKGHLTVSFITRCVSHEISNLLHQLEGECGMVLSWCALLCKCIGLPENQDVLKQTEAADD